MPKLNPTTPAAELLNLGSKSAQQLETIGIQNLADLQQADLLEVYTQLKMRDPSVTKVLYYALWGAVHNVHWQNVPKEVKEKINVLNL